MKNSTQHEFHILFHHCGLELCQDHVFRKITSIKNDAMKRNKKIHEVLFDKATHTVARYEKELEGRGRPDILHSSLLNAMYSPLIKEKKLILHVLTIDNLYFKIPSDWRVPVNYKRFYSLMEHFLNKKTLNFGEKAIQLKNKSIEEIITIINPKSILKMTATATRELKQFDLQEKSLFLIGCYQKGEFDKSIRENFKKNNLISEVYLDKNQVVPAWRITAKIIFLIEENLLSLV